jgi:hypothetical protein
VNSYFTPFFFANDWAHNNNLSPHIATYTVTVSPILLLTVFHRPLISPASLPQFLNAGSFFGRALSGPIAETFGAIETFVSSGILSGIVIVALWTTRGVGTAGTIIGAFLYGLFSGESFSAFTFSREKEKKGNANHGRTER